MKIHYIEGNYNEGKLNLVRNNESPLYPVFIIPREFVRGLLVIIQGTRHVVRYIGMFFISGVSYIGTSLY